jgi:hypothetical protein
MDARLEIVRTKLASCMVVQGVLPVQIRCKEYGIQEATPLKPLDLHHLMKRYFPEDVRMSGSDMDLYKEILRKHMERNTVILENIYVLQQKLLDILDDAYTKSDSEPSVVEHAETMMGQIDRLRSRLWLPTDMH